MTARILVTGASGFVGQRLVDKLRGRLPHATVVASDHAPTRASDITLDVANQAQVESAIMRIQPTAVVHLAAIAAVQDSVSAPHATWQVNTIGTLNLVEAIQANAPECRLLHVSTAEVYGRTAFSGEPVTEHALLAPMNPYATSKAAADLMVQEAAGRGLRAIIARPFNHTGPGQIEKYVVPAFCAQVAKIEKGEQDPVILVGELNDERDFLDVEDVTDLYIDVLEANQKLESGLVLNVCSGIPRSIDSILTKVLSLSDRQIEVRQDPARLRQTRVPRIIGSRDRVSKVIGWTPKRSFDQTIEDCLRYWRETV